MAAFFVFVPSISAEKLLVDVSPIFPENQDPKIKNYFSINTNETHFKQTISFILTNNSNNDVTIQIEPLNALNSSNKGIQYTSKVEENYTRLLDEQYALAKFIQIDKKVTLKGGETKRIHGEIDIPKLDGTILGAVSFKTLNDAKETKQNQISIHNEINRIIGVQINLQKELKNIKPIFEVLEPYVEEMPAYFVIRLPIELKSSLLMKNVLLEYEVFDSKENLLFKSKEEQPFNMAPNTYTSFALPWQYETIKENDEYIIKGELKYEGGSITFNKTFKYEKKQVQGNGNQFGKPKVLKDNTTFLILAVVLLIAFIGIGVIYFMKKRRNEKSKL